jgi:predicted O-methyltransferase YrrM
MQATQLLQEIFSNKVVSNLQGETFPLHSSIDHQEGEFLQQLILQYKPQKSIEIGCAYGLSSLYICDALQKNGNRPQHTIIDPFQKTQWNSVGISNLEKANLRFFDLIEKVSELAMPELLAQNKQYDFIFIDGWHTLDHTLVDLFYANRMLKVGGILVVDDVVTIRPVNKAMRYFANYPAYKFIGKAPMQHSWKRKLYYTITEIASLFTYLLPYRKQIFNATFLDSDRKVQLDASMVAFEKIAEDDRTWNWYVEF